MAEDKGLSEKKLTKSSENLNPVYLGDYENKQKMGGSVQSSRATTNGVQAETPQAPLKRDDSYPSSLHSTSTCSTYSLEISMSTNDNNIESQPLHLKTLSVSRNGHKKDANPPSPLVPPCGGKKSDGTNSCRIVDPEMHKKAVQKFTQCLDNMGSLQIASGKNPNTSSGLEKTFVSSPSHDRKLEAQPRLVSRSTCNDNGPDSKTWQANQEMEDMFYAFVIMHAEEDTNEAVRLRKLLESISSTSGATFSEDFEQPGYSTFRCVEDAIENSAYTLLLLTENFSTRLNETNTDSVLMNSIEKPHKYNTVIPLIPEKNRLSHFDIPLVLRSKNPLDERKGRDIFEKLVRKFLNSRNIDKQRTVWIQEQQLKKEREKKQMLEQENRRRRAALRESEKVRELEEQRRQLQQQQAEQGLHPPFASQPDSLPSFPRPAHPCGPMPSQWPGPVESISSMNMWPQSPSSIHIQNARYIMIGNNSTMTVEGVVDSEDED